MKTVLLIICLTFCKAITAQSSYSFEGVKTIGTHYKLPAIGLSYAYKHDLFVGEAGMKTNFQEYYTLLFLSVGAETKGKLLVGANFGIGSTFNLPRTDRIYHDRQYEYLSKGFDKNSITAIYGNAKLGYQIFDGCYMYGSYSFSYKWQWVSVGIKLSNTKK